MPTSSHLPDIPSQLVISDTYVIVKTTDDGLYTLTVIPTSNIPHIIISTHDYEELVKHHSQQTQRLNNSSLSPYPPLPHSSSPPEIHT